jgi:hypothetical protein
MKCKTHDGAEVVSQSMLKRGVERSGERLQEMTTFKMEAFQPPGLRPIKQVELFKKIDGSFLVHTGPKSALNHLKK